MSPETGHSDVTTHGIRVRVASQYLAEESDPEANVWVFVYRVVLTNMAERSMKLLSRHWIIRDANGDRRDVRGPGVVGEQPEIAPGANYEYRSSCPLTTPWGTMEGSYRCSWEDGTQFEARIGRFFLAQNTAPITAQEGPLTGS
jgi:ApaG protein